jgi:hypothetical protein
MANKKINQLVSKTAILSTDIFGIGDATTGQLFKKTIAELQAAIGGAVISVNGLVGTVVLDTDDIQELATPTNKYFTDARARGAISLTVTGNSGASTYSSGTGVLNVPTYTLAGLGGITATFLSGTSGISYNSTTGVISYSGTVYTDASIRALLSGSTGISYNSTTGAISYSGTVYTDSSVRALISITTTGTSGASTYNNTTGVINVPNYTLAGLGGISLTSLSGGTGITYNNTTGAISYSGTVYTDASVRALISATGNISYNSTTGVISTSLTQYTDALARASISLTTTGTSGVATYNSTTGVFNIPNYGSALSGYLPLTGGTLTGALGGTSATFSSSVTVNGTLIAGASNGNIRIKGSADGFLGAGDTDGKLYLTDWTTGAKGLSILLSTGAATFSSSVFIGTGSPTSPTRTLEVSTGSDTYSRVTGNRGNADGVHVGNIEFYNSFSSILVGEVRGITGTGGTQSGSGQLAFYTNNAGTYAERMRITSAGNVGIGTTSPSSLLHIVSSVTTTTTIGLKDARIILQNNTFTGDAGGEVVLGAIADTNIGRYASIGTSMQSNGSGGASGDVYIATKSVFTDTTLIPRIYIQRAGNVLIGTTTDNGYKLYVSGTIYATGNITANSDLTLKKNLTIIDNAVDKLMQLNGYAYQWKEDDSHQYGVIAQEVEKILPYAVSTGTDGIKGVSYNQIIPVLIEAVKEQKTKIENLEILLASK